MQLSLTCPQSDVCTCSGTECKAVTFDCGSVTQTTPCTNRTLVTETQGIETSGANIGYTSFLCVILFAFVSFVNTLY